MSIYRAPILLCLLTACFTDDEGRPGVTAVPPESSSSSDETAAGESTTGPPDTGDTTAPTSTGPACACEPGEVLRGDPCGACGVTLQTCGEDCTYGPAMCDDPPDACAYWVLPGDATAWERVPRADRPAPFAPSAPALGAFPIAATRQIMVLTDTKIHVLDAVARTWIAEHPRDAWFPEIAGLPLHLAHAVTQPDELDATVTLVAGEDRFVYPYAHDAGVAALAKQEPCCGQDWSTADAPDFHAVRDVWGDLDDARDWATGDVAALCGLDEPTDFVAYTAVVTDDAVHMQELGHCYDFFPATPYADFPPFTYPGTPPSQRIGGAAWLDGLWIFPGP